MWAVGAVRNESGLVGIVALVHVRGRVRVRGWEGGAGSGPESVNTMVDTVTLE